MAGLLSRKNIAKVIQMLLWYFVLSYVSSLTIDVQDTTKYFYRLQLVASNAGRKVRSRPFCSVTLSSSNTYDSRPHLYTYDDVSVEYFLLDVNGQTSGYFG